ncbi:MAG: murein biosynthesis integral membrane protein MurJ, partial [Deltaproteobacteria bacterium]
MLDTKAQSSRVNRRIAFSAGIVMVSVLASRFLGFLRDWTVAHQIGSNAITDTYYAAFTLPDFLNYLVAGGALSLTFIPVFAKYASENREEEGWKVFSTVITVMGVVLAVLVVAGEIYAPHLVEIISPGFPVAEKARVIFLTRLMLPAQIFFYLGSILSAVQYAKARFVIPSLAPVIYNAGIVLGGLLLSRRIGITGFAVGVLGGAFVGNFLLQVYGASTVGARFRVNTEVGHEGFRLFVKLTVPIMIGQSLIMTDDWIIRWFGSFLAPASISWLSYAKTLMKVPLGVVGQAAGVASFPFLAQLYSEKKYDQLNHSLNVTIKGVLLLLLPTSALTIAQSRPLVYFIYSHTRMSHADLDATAHALVFFSIAMAAWGLQTILSRGFYAARDTMTPAVTGTILTVLVLPLYWLLSRRMQYLGLALASSTGVIVYTLILFVLLDRRLHNREAGGLVAFMLKMAIASVLSAAAAYEVV